MKLKKDTLFIACSIILIVGLSIVSFLKVEGNLKFFLIVLYVILLVVNVIIFFSVKGDANKELAKVTYMIESHGNDLFTNMPIGVVSINSSGIILWANNYFKSLFDDTLDMRSITEIFPNIMDDLAESKEVTVEINEDYYKAVKSNEAIFFFEDTERVETEKKYSKGKLVMGAISFDNYEDYYNSLDEQRSNEITSHMAKLINQWCAEFGIYLRKYSNSRYLMIMNADSLDKVIEDTFSILDLIRNYGNRTKLPLTISMSIARDVDDIRELSDIVFEGLDLVLSRGGDQVVIKSGLKKTDFYGGKTDAIEKRNRVKARMFSGSVANFVRKSKNVIIMGHKDADFDSIGGCVGMSKLALELNANVSVALDIAELSPSSRKLIRELEDTDFYDLIKDPNEVLKDMVRETLVIVVDTHKVNMVESPDILEKSKNTIIIDHHRRGEGIIPNPILSYIEPYASSTSELVTELISFQLNDVNISSLEATAMLAGIIMDTKSFVYRTGNRTFDAAATLKAKGADTIVIQDLLKEEKAVVVARNNLISNIEVVGDNCAITYTSDRISQVILAQAADEILKIEGIKASFVLGKFDENTISLSTRSLGEVNVQLIAEQFGGGGHMTAAAARISSDNINEVVEALKSVLDGGNLDESSLSS
ncbi:MAG: DHH family phosphoesterase [Bacilli bacterium]